MDGNQNPPSYGPRGIGQLAEIGIGAYTDITAIYGPAEAAYGDLVSVEVRVRNLSGSPIHISTTGRYDGIDFALNPEYVSVGAGLTQSFTYSFYMPNNDVRLDVWTFYWTGTEWYQDDHEYVAIALAVPPEVYAGTIIGIELEHDGTQEGIPVYDIPQGQTYRAHVWGRNDMSTTQRLGIHWIVRDPDGEVVEDYEDWSLLYYRQGADHEFKGGYFNLDKPGTYTINIALSMNPADPEIVDDYYGTLCTVAQAVPEPSFRGFGVSEYQTV